MYYMVLFIFEQVQKESFLEVLILVHLGKSRTRLVSPAVPFLFPPRLLLKHLI